MITRGFFLIGISKAIRV